MQQNEVTAEKFEDFTTAIVRKPRVIAPGLALFAMFFGAGNMIFPLYLGVHTGQHLWWVALGFLLTGVGTPFLGLFATSLFEGDYWAFFNRLGALPGFLVITFVMFIIGPFSAAPRTELVTYNTLLPFLPGVMKSEWVFSALFCGLVFILTVRRSQLIHLLGCILSPIKLVSFFTLIALGIFTFHPHLMTNPTSALTSFSTALSTGYGTMDMLASFFFCTLAYNAIQHDAHRVGVTDRKEIIRTTLKACLIGAVTLSVVYLGFIFVTAGHAEFLQNVPQEKIIDMTARAILGRFGEFFVCLCVFFACLATAIALAEISTEYLYEHVLSKKMSRLLCLTVVIAIMFLMTHLGFGRIMKILLPILDVLYPSLIVLCIVNILYKTVGFKWVKLPVWGTAACLLIYDFYQYL